ncbi:MAG TPA: hypothetical protein VEB22_03725 [Phycisphaerales bacterium]|nr:hypothetical protein [Phycisphaerales bacterium]
MILRTEYGWGEPNTNPGDLIVELGARRLAMRLGIDLDAADTVYLIGTPWFWKGCWASQKYDWLRAAHAMHADKRWVAIGVGSCFALEERADEAICRDGTLLQAAAWWRENIHGVITRDQRATAILRPSTAMTLPCPSLWSAFDVPDPVPGRVLAVTCDPWHAECVPPAAGWLNETNFQVGYGRRAWSEGDIALLLLDVLSGERIISQRIHCALPAAPWRPVRVVPMDGRVATTRNVGLPDEPGAWSNPDAVRALMNQAELRYRQLLCG